MANLRKYLNNFEQTFNGAVLVGDTVITLTDGSDLPIITGSEFYMLTFFDVATELDIEVVKVTARSGNDITCVRAQEGTIAFAFADLDNVEMRPTQDSFERLAEGDQSVRTTDSPTFADATIDGDLFSVVRDSEFSNAQSGLITGGVVTINADPTKFDISAGTGKIVDYYTDPTSPTITEVSWNAVVAQAPTNIATEEVTILHFDINGDLQQTNDISPSQDFLRDVMIAGSVFHPDNVNIIAATSLTRLAFASNTMLTDLISSLGAINISGNIFTANATGNLQVDKTSGSTFGETFNRTSSNKNPNTTTDSTLVTAVLSYFHQDGSGGFIQGGLVTNIDPDSFDDGTGVLATVDNNKYTIQRLLFTPATGLTGIEYGQNQYMSLEAAESALLTEAHIAIVPISFATLRCWLIVKKGTTDLTVTANAKFIIAPNLSGAIGGATAAASLPATMQSAYDSSTNPEIVLDDTKSEPAHTIRDSSTPVSGNLTEVQDFAGTTDYETLTTALKTYGVNVDHGAFYSDFTEISIPSNPAANEIRLYAKDNGGGVTKLFALDSSGTETDLLGAGGGGGATTELDNLGTVAINTSLISDTDSTDNLGSTGIRWLNAWVDTVNVTTSTIYDGSTSGTTTVLSGAIAGSSVLTLPVATDTLVGKATTDTLTNKTFDANGTGNSLSNVDVTDLANGTDGELITWSPIGVAETVDVGTATHVLTSNGVGVAPTFQVPSGGDLDINALVLYPTTTMSAFNDRIALYDDSAGINYKIGVDVFLGIAIESLSALSTGSYNKFDRVVIADVDADVAKYMQGHDFLFGATNTVTTATFLDTTNDRIGFADVSAGDFLNISPLNLAKTTTDGMADDSAIDAAADFISYKDTSASVMKKLTPNALFGREIPIGESNLAGGEQTIADDAVYSFTPTSDIGMIIIAGRDDAYKDVHGMFSYRTAATNYIVEMFQTGINIEVTTGVLTGTTGTDIKMTISTHTDGKIYIENRLGGSRSILFNLLGT